MYRDDTAAARVHLAMLERQVAQHRSVSGTLKSYRNALVDELQRLEHAVLWYTNGEKYGFNEARRKDDLSPARRADAAPSHDAIAATVFSLPHDQVAARTAQILRELSVEDPGSDELNHQVRALETQCATLRAQVEELAAKHPDHPPPPEYKASIWTVVVPVAFLAAAIAAATLLIL